MSLHVLRKFLTLYLESHTMVRRALYGLFIMQLSLNYLDFRWKLAGRS